MSEDLHELVATFQKTMAHAWMVRTFIKHCDEVEDYPELMVIVRAVFDMSRAIESKADDPALYFKFARKKIGKLKKSVWRVPRTRLGGVDTHQFSTGCAVCGIRHRADGIPAGRLSAGGGDRCLSGRATRSSVNPHGGVDDGRQNLPRIGELR